MVNTVYYRFWVHCESLKSIFKLGSFHFDLIHQVLSVSSSSPLWLKLPSSLSWIITPAPQLTNQASCFPRPRLFLQHWSFCTGPQAQLIPISTHVQVVSSSSGPYLVWVHYIISSMTNHSPCNTPIHHPIPMVLKVWPQAGIIKSTINC